MAQGIRTPFRQGFTNPDARDFVHLDFSVFTLQLYILNLDAAHHLPGDSGVFAFVTVLAPVRVPPLLSMVTSSSMNTASGSSFATRSSEQQVEKWRGSKRFRLRSCADANALFLLVCAP
jgi:hypothetical protein